jgi:MFS family permease
MTTIALSWLVYRLTGSSLLLGAVTFAGQIPVFLLAPLGGTVADRYSRHKVVTTTHSVSMFLSIALGLLTISGLVKIWEIFAFSTLLGCVNAFAIPARQAFIVEMVTKEDMMNAIALNSSMFNGARIIGPAVAGFVVAHIGEGWCFLADGISYIAVIIGLLMMRIPARARSASETSALSDIREGFSFVRRTSPIRALLILLGLVSLVAMPYSVLMPIFADKILHSGARGLGILMGATGVGALVGALTLAMRSSLRGLGQWVAICSAGFGVSLVAFSFSKSFHLSTLLLLPVGFFMMFQMSSSNTLIQAMVPDQLRGRVMSVYSMMFMGMAPLGALLAGWLADIIGAPWTIAGGGIVSVIGAIVFGVHLPMIRGEARRLIVAQSLAGGDPAQEMFTRPVEEAGKPVP